jgi:hypothetical protein
MALSHVENFSLRRRSSPHPATTLIHAAVRERSLARMTISTS